MSQKEIQKNSVKDSLEKQKEEILSAFKIQKKAHCNIKNRVPVRIITEKREEVSSGEDVSKVLKIINRDRSNWKYLTEQPVPDKITTEKIIDKRKPHLKKQYIAYIRSKEIKGIDKKTICSICLNTYSVVNICGLLKCNHFFHRKCIDLYISTAGFCPICRRDVISGLIN